MKNASIKLKLALATFPSLVILIVCLVFFSFAVNGTVDFAYEKMTCAQVLGPNLVKIVKLFITIIRIAGAIIAIISGMLTFVPAVVSDDAGALKKATKKAIIIMVILVAIGIFPTLIGIIGRIGGFDLSCLY